VAFLLCCRILDLESSLISVHDKEIYD